MTAAGGAGVRRRTASPAPRPLQNRVTPRGDLIRSPARGTLMGNRGRLHDTARRIVRRVAPGSRAWVTCRLRFLGQRRRVMAPGRYTELFFLDEATALAAGHRPCGECRRADFRRFKRAWQAGNRGVGPGVDPPIAAIDRVLHRERIGADGALWRWTPAGYADPEPARPAALVTVLTPRSTVAAIAAGYVPAVHPSATA